MSIPGIGAVGARGESIEGSIGLSCPILVISMLSAPSAINVAQLNALNGIITLNDSQNSLIRFTRP